MSIFGVLGWLHHPNTPKIRFLRSAILKHDIVQIVWRRPIIIMTRVQTEIFLGVFFITVTAAILLFVGFNEEKRMTEFEGFQKAQQIEVGAELFEINCRGCHGTRGEGIAGLAPPLNDEHFFTQRLEEVGWQGTIEDYIVSTVASGRQISTRPELYPGAGSPAMPTWSEQYGGPLRIDQIEDIASFIINWEPTALGLVEITELPTPTPRVEELDDPVARGQVVYQQNGCGGCHTIEGLSAGAVGPNLTKVGEVAATRIEGVSAEDYIRTSIDDPSAYIVEDYADLMLKTYRDTLSQEELEDLVAFLSIQK